MTDITIDSRGTNASAASTNRPTGVLLSYEVGTNASLTTAGFRVWFVPFVTSSAVQRATRLLGIDREVVDLRDAVAAKGLKRSDIASALGVDRRTLSGYCSGEFRPPPERLDRMRILARVVTAIDAANPGRARDVLLAQRGGVSLVERLPSERLSLLWSWRRYSEPEASVTIEVQSEESEPNWAPAARALAEGRLAPPPRRPSVRPPEAYEMDLDEAAEFTEPRSARGRASYR